jgi:hypothetical protein
MRTKEFQALTLDARVPGSPWPCRARGAPTTTVMGYGIEKSSVSRQFVAATSNQLRALCERRLEDLNLVVLMIDGIHFGGQLIRLSRFYSKPYAFPSGAFCIFPQ